MTGTEPSLRAQLQRRAYEFTCASDEMLFAINPAVEGTGEKRSLPGFWQLGGRGSLQRRQENQDEKKSVALSSAESHGPWWPLLIALHSVKAQLLDCPHRLGSCTSCNVVSDLLPTESWGLNPPGTEASCASNIYC